MHEATVEQGHDPALAREALAAAAVVGPTALDATSGAIWVLRHEEIDRLAHDARMAGVGLTWFDMLGVDGALRRWYGSLMFTNEGDAHSRLRRLVSRAFTPRSSERMRADTAATIDELFTALQLEGGGDLVAAFDRVAMRVMCRLLGVPEDDVAIFGSWADALSPVFGLMDPEQIVAAQAAIIELLEYVAQLVERRHGDPKDDLITALLAAEDDGDRLQRSEVVDMVANLLVGGHDTTTSQIGCTLLTLLQHPHSVDELRAENVAVSAAVTETMRYEPSIGIVPRTVVAPLEIGGIERAPGTPVLLSVLTGNRDPAVWEQSDAFDVHRFTQPSAPRLLSFGTGPHYCLGANLARMTIEETVRGFVARDVRPATDLGAVEWRLVLGRSPVALPVTVA